MKRNKENYTIFESVLKCKWTLALLDKISIGIKQPGKLQRSIPGLSAKVMYERLRKLERFNIVARKLRNKKPLIVHYFLTAYGKRVIQILRLIKKIAEIPN